MRKLIFLTIALILSFSKGVYCQKDDAVDFERFKKMLPFLMQGIQKQATEAKPVIDRAQRTECALPWEMKTFSESEIKSIIEKLENNAAFKIIENKDGSGKLNLICNFQDFKTEPKLKKEFQNLIIEISEFNIKDEKGVDIYLAKKKNILQPKKDGIQKLILQGAQLNAFIPISLNYNSVSGSIKITVKEKQDFSFKEISKAERNIQFQISNQEMELIEIKKNKAVFRVSQKQKGLKIFSTNELNQKHVRGSTLFIPENIYLESMKPNLTKADFELFAKEYSIDEYRKDQQSYMCFYETSGTIEKIYVYRSNELVEKGTCTIDIKL